MNKIETVQSPRGHVRCLEVDGSPVAAWFDRIVTLLQDSLTEAELGLFAEPVMDGDGHVSAWRTRSGKALEPIKDLPMQERARLLNVRDRVFQKIRAVIDTLEADGGSDRAEIDLLTAMLVTPGPDMSFFSDGDRPVLINWGSTLEDDAALAGPSDPGADASEVAFEMVDLADEPEVDARAKPDPVDAPEVLVGSGEVISWSDTQQTGRNGAGKSALMARTAPFAVLAMISVVALTSSILSGNAPSPESLADRAGTSEALPAIGWAPDTDAAPGPATIAWELSSDATRPGPRLDPRPLTAPPERLAELSVPSSHANGFDAPARPKRPGVPVPLRNHDLLEATSGLAAVNPATGESRVEFAAAPSEMGPGLQVDALALTTEGDFAGLLAYSDQPPLGPALPGDAAPGSVNQGNDVGPLPEPSGQAEATALASAPRPIVRPANTSSGAVLADNTSSQADLDRIAAAEEDLRLTRRARAVVQRRLGLLGFDPRGVDGIFGVKTRAAISAWQQAHHRPETGYLDAGQLAAIERTSARRYAAWQQTQAARAEAEAARARTAARAQRHRQLATGRTFRERRFDPDTRGTSRAGRSPVYHQSTREALDDLVRLVPAFIDELRCRGPRHKCRWR